VRNTVKFGGGLVMVLSAITSRGVGKLIFIEDKMNSEMFCDILNTGLFQTLEKKTILSF